MAFTETYRCDVCGDPKTEDSHDWWLGMSVTEPPVPGAPAQPVLKLTPWSRLLSHSPAARHLCGARCAQTQLDRWMAAHVEHHGE